MATKMRFIDKVKMSLEGVTIALDAMRANKVRAGLTILGVAIGVFVVVVISAAVHGINESVAQQFQSAGPTTFFVSRYPISFENCQDAGDTCKWLSNPPLTFNEFAALSQMSSVDKIMVQQGSSVAARYRDHLLSQVQIIGVTAEWPEINPPDMTDGRVFTDQESRAAAPVAILNTNAKNQLFGDNDAIGKEITLNSLSGGNVGGSFTVIGVYKDNVSFLSGGDHPKIMTSIYALSRKLGAQTKYMSFVVKPSANVSQAETIDDVTASLRGQRGLRPSHESNFAILTQEKLLDVYNSVFRIFFLVMISLSSVGLLVGGVGVVAIMMISVTERTREIGVRKALGATRGVILWQFLVEAVTLTATGASIGLIVGWVVALMVTKWTPIQASVPPLAVIMALLSSAATGIVFGMLPALKASRLDPVAALRYE